MSEQNNGEIDAVFTPADVMNINEQKQSTFLNFTAILSAVGKDKFNISPRKVFCGTHVSLGVSDEKKKSKLGSSEIEE